MAARLFSALGFIVTSLIVTLLLSIFIFPNPEKEYFGFWHGLLGALHGSWIIANWIIGLFNEARLLKAVTYGSWYGFFWWAGVVIYIIVFIYNVFVRLFITVED